MVVEAAIGEASLLAVEQLSCLLSAVSELLRGIKYLCVSFFSKQKVVAKCIRRISLLYNSYTSGHPALYESNCLRRREIITVRGQAYVSRLPKY